MTLELYYNTELGLGAVIDRMYRNMYRNTGFPISQYAFWRIIALLVVYVYGGLNSTTWEAQWLEHRLISEGRGIKLVLG